MSGKGGSVLLYWLGCIDCLGNLNSDPTNCYRFSDYFQFGILDPDPDADSPDSKTNRFLHFSTATTTDDNLSVIAQHHIHTLDSA